MLQRSLKMSLPEILRGEAPALLEVSPPPEAGDVVMFLYIDFAVRERDIRGRDNGAATRSEETPRKGIRNIE